MSKVQQHIQAAKDFIYGEAETASMTQATAVFKQVKGDLKQLQEEQVKHGLYSAVGLAVKEREIRDKGAKELAQMVAKFRKAVDMELDAAEKEARAIIARPVGKPEQHVIDAFSDTYQDAVTRLTVFGTREAAHTLLQLMSSVTDPHIARTLVDDFAKFGSAMKPHVDAMRLETVYNHTRAIAETDAKVVAKTSLQEIERLRAASPVNAMINIGVSSTLGDAHKNVIANYQSYLD
jgi:hypothetical protein